MSNKWIIAKHANKDYWSFYYEENPIETGLPLAHNCSTTFAGRELSIKQYYENHSEAIKDCNRINKINPCGGYAVIPVVE